MFNDNVMFYTFTFIMISDNRNMYTMQCYFYLTMFISILCSMCFNEENILFLEVTLVFRIEMKNNGEQYMNVGWMKTKDN